MNLLLHVCCAPCQIFPVEEVANEGHKVTGFFYNPNIHPYSEYLRRKGEAERYSKDVGIEAVSAGYDLAEYFRAVAHNESADKRCQICWRLRMEETARFAAENDFDAFTSTLLGSPYQDHGAIKNICEMIAKRLAIKFYYKDYRTGFREAHRKAKAKGIYCQNYCGCVFSEKERLERSRQTS